MYEMYERVVVILFEKCFFYTLYAYNSVLEYFS